MSKDRAVRSSRNFKPTNKLSKSKKTKSHASFKSREKPKYRSGAKPNNRTRDTGRDETKRRFPSRTKNKSNYRSSNRPSNRYEDRSRRESDRGTKELHTATCARCKKETTVPFKPTGVKPVFCRECFQIEKPKADSTDVRRRSSRSDSRRDYRSSSKSSSRYDDRSRRQSDRGTKELHTATCAKCKKETTVPFKPTGVKPVYCRECFQEQKEQDGFTTSRTKRDFSDNRRRSARTSSGRQIEERIEVKQEESSSVDKDDEVVERFGDRSGPYRPTKRMHHTTCRTCKKEITIPFKPKSRPIYCQECFQKEGKKK